MGNGTKHRNTTAAAGLFAVMALAVALDSSGAPPTEFRLFVSGWNETQKGRFLFDADAATATMAAYKEWGIDLMIDLEHQSLEEETPPEPTAKDARGWCNLELRADGSLWAVNVAWTPDGTARLTEKRQRYVSPAFAYDTEKRVVQIVNVAITAMPATHNTPALMAACSSKRMAKMAASGPLSPKLVSSALAAVAAKDKNAALDVLQQFLAALLGGAPSDEAPPSSAQGGAPDSSAAGAGAGAGDDDATKQKDNMAAASRVAMALTGKTDPAEAMAELTRRSQVSVELEKREATLAADRKVVEDGERRTLVGALVKLRSETPATAWSDDKGTVPCDRLSVEPIADLRARVAKLTAAAGVKPPGPGGPITPPPAGGAADAHGLDARELAICEAAKCEPATFAMLKARRNGHNTTT
jgi:phage I-like protein